jgi:hypothetical protein
MLTKQLVMVKGSSEKVQWLQQFCKSEVSNKADDALHPFGSLSLGVQTGWKSGGRVQA